jgi:lantibiotic modifying enzyme
METKDVVLLISTIVVPIITGLWSYLAATSKAKRDITHLREQNRLDIEKLMNQHKLDLESLERKHEMDIEKMQIEHQHKIELMQKEMENKMGADLMQEMIAQALNMPEFRQKLRQSARQGMTSRKK